MMLLQKVVVEMLGEPLGGGLEVALLDVAGVDDF
jgi:hypothetical protein